MVQKRASSIRKNYKFRNLFLFWIFWYFKPLRRIGEAHLHFIVLCCFMFILFVFRLFYVWSNFALFFQQHYLKIKSRRKKNIFFVCRFVKEYSMIQKRASSIKKNQKFQNRFLCCIFWYFKPIHRIDKAHLQFIVLCFFMFILFYVWSNFALFFNKGYLIIKACSR